MQRRTFIAAAGATTAAASIAGCVSRVSGGTKDLVVNSCLDGDGSAGDEETTVDVRIRSAGSEDTVFDERVAVPAMSCSDVVDGVSREDVFPAAGTYTVAVTADGYDPLEQRVEFSEREIEDNSDNVVVTVREERIEIA